MSYVSLDIFFPTHIDQSFGGGVRKKIINEVILLY